MQNFNAIALEIFSVYIAIAVGFFIRKYRREKINLDTLTELIIYLGSPCLAFTKLAVAKYQIREIGVLVLAMLFIIAGSGLLTLLVIKNFRLKSSNVVYLTTMFMNTANVGFPVTIFTLGAVAFQKAIILDLAMVICLFSVGIGIVSGKYNEWLKIPVIYAAAIGLFFSFQGIKVPELIYRPLNLLGEITIPLMLISLGGKLAELKKIKSYFLPVIVTLVRSAGGFIIGLLFVTLAGLKGLTKEVILLYSALPAPVMAYVLAQKYKQNDILAAEIVFASNLMAIIILPVVVYIIKFLI